MLIVLGGKGKKESHKTVNIYQVNSGNIIWSHKRLSSSVPWTCAGKTLYKNNLYVAGGQTWDKASKSPKPQYHAARYHIKQDRWYLLPNMTWATTHGPAIFVHGEILYIAGGTNMPTSTKLHFLNLSKVNDMNKWNEHKVKAPGYGSGPNAVVNFNGRVYTVHVPCKGTRHRESCMMSWNPDTDSEWRQHAYMKIRRQNGQGVCSVTDQQHYIWVLGGCKKCSCKGFMEKFTISTGNWTKITSLPSFRLFGGIDSDVFCQLCQYVDGHIFAVFSASLTQRLDSHIYVYDTLNDIWSASETELKEAVYQPVSAVVPLI